MEPIASTGVPEELIHEVGGDYYIGKIRGRNLWVIIERLTKENREGWAHYATQQCKANVRMKDGDRVLLPKGGSLNSGAIVFRDVIKETNIDQNEVWVAYVSSYPFMTQNPEKFANYSCNLDSILKKEVSSESSLTPSSNKSFAKYLKMFVSVTSSPKARITTHLGICKTIESIEEPEKNLSMDLHAICAMVMLMRNPERRFMVNPPVPFMTVTMAKTCPPQSLYFGTKQDLMQFESGEHNPYYQFYDKVNARVRKVTEDFDLKLFLQEHPPILSRERSQIYGGPVMKIFEPNASEQLWIEIDKSNPDYEWFFSKQFQNYGQCYIAVDLRNLSRCRSLEPLSEWVDTYKWNN